MTAPLSDRLESVKWGEFKLGELFDVISYAKRFDANKVTVLTSGGHPYIVRQSGDNGQKGYIEEDPAYLNEGNTISFGQDTATMFYQEFPYFTGDKIKILKAKCNKFSKKNAQFFLAAMRKSFSLFAWGSSRFNVDTLIEQKVELPVTASGDIDFDFMESFIAELEAERTAELETYLKVTGMIDCELTPDDRQTLEDFDSADWDDFNLENLFGKSTRGKRLKSEDRIPGSLPFVTAGEAETGVSAFIGNAVEEFTANTVTIDMFGSGKYRNYTYGADDHVTVVHTEKLPKGASIFVAAACHKAAYTGEFNYGHNFYPKDADQLVIKLPSKQGAPDYPFMARLISAIQKLVIKDVVLYANRKIEATKKVIESHCQTVEKGVS